MNSAEIIQDYENKNRILGEKIVSLEADNFTYQKRCEQYALAYDQLQHQLKELLRNRFGKKSERFIDRRSKDFPQKCYQHNSTTLQLAFLKS